MPRIDLAIDNCFASKRWTKPEEWLSLAGELGFSYVEASADNECDPMFMGPDYMYTWAREVVRAQDKTGVKVANLYSGHGTYATLGLAHTDPKIRERFLTQWMFPMVDAAAAVDAGLGFFAHAFPVSVLQSGEEYEENVEALFGNLSRIAAYAGEKGVQVSVEQMYSPNQYPWTLRTAGRLLRECWQKAGHPMYITADVGHMYGQRQYLRPDRQAILSALAGERPRPWLGTEAAYDLYDLALVGPEAERAAIADQILESVARNGHLFADDPADSDPYAWLKEYACASPIIHLQQTDGLSSAHRPFTGKYNAGGIITPERVLDAIRQCYARPVQADMPPRCERIRLTVEAFSGTAQKPREIVEDLRASAKWLRENGISDGMEI